MSKVTIRTGTSKPTTNKIPDNIEKFVSPAKDPQDVQFCEAFQNDPQASNKVLIPNDSSDFKESSIPQKDLNPLVYDQVETDELTVLARFLPKANSIATNSTSLNLEPNSDIDGNQEHRSKNDAETETHCTGKNLEADLGLKTITERNADVSNINIECASASSDSMTTDKNVTQKHAESIAPDPGTGVTTVLGSGHSPENDPDHSMLKFAVFEVQDLTEELKKLRDLLDTLSESPGDIFREDENSEANPEDALKLKLFENSIDIQSGVDSLNSYSTTSPVDNRNDDPVSNEDHPATNMTSNGSNGMKFATVVCKSQTESSFCKGSFKCCEINEYSEYSEEIRILKGYNQEIAAVVK